MGRGTKCDMRDTMNLVFLTKGHDTLKSVALSVPKWPDRSREFPE
jgi:hypothetical protein